MSALGCWLAVSSFISSCTEQSVPLRHSYFRLNKRKWKGTVNKWVRWSSVDFQDGWKDIFIAFVRRKWRWRWRTYGAMLTLNSEKWRPQCRHHILSDPKIYHSENKDEDVRNWIGKVTYLKAETNFIDQNHLCWDLMIKLHHTLSSAVVQWLGSSHYEREKQGQKTWERNKKKNRFYSRSFPAGQRVCVCVCVCVCYTTSCLTVHHLSVFLSASCEGTNPCLCGLVTFWHHPSTSLLHPTYRFPDAAEALESPLSHCCDNSHRPPTDLTDTACVCGRVCFCLTQATFVDKFLNSVYSLLTFDLTSNSFIG